MSRKQDANRSLPLRRLALGSPQLDVRQNQGSRHGSTQGSMTAHDIGSSALVFHIVAAKAHRLALDWAGILIQLPCPGLGDTCALLVEHSVGLATTGFWQSRYWRSAFMRCAGSEACAHILSSPGCSLPWLFCTCLSSLRSTAPGKQTWPCCPRRSVMATACC